MTMRARVSYILCLPASRENRRAPHKPISGNLFKYSPSFCFSIFCFDDRI
jgi:hypothetical protein